MDLKMVITGLTGQIGELEKEIKEVKKEKEILELIDSLKNIKNPTLGYNKMFLNKAISKDAMEEFVSLLDTDEYLKGQSNGGRDFGGDRKRKSTFDHYYLTFGEGTLLELTFRESEYTGYEEISREPIKECGVSCRMYISEDDLVFQTSYEYGFPMLKMNQGENEIFSSPTLKNDYSQCNGRKVNEVLSPISPETLVERFYEKKQQEVKKQTK